MNRISPDGDLTLNGRQREMLDLARRRGFVAIEEMARHFGVTAQTVRRDINGLCKRGVLHRYHGGAGVPSSVENMSYGTRQVMFLAEKRRIAEMVAARIPDRASLFVNIGTTTEEVARRLRSHQGLKVITNNLNVATILSAHPRGEVIVAGGVVRPRDRAIIGEAAVDLINQFKVDYAIVGISGIDGDGTLLDFDYQEVRVAQAIIGNARRVYLVADHSKFARRPMVRLGHISQVDALFTDKPLDKDMAVVFERAQTAVYVAAPEAAD